MYEFANVSPDQAFGRKILSKPEKGNSETKSSPSGEQENLVVFQSGLPLRWTVDGPAVPEMTKARLRTLSVKRKLDILIAFAGIFFLAPLLIAVALAIKLTSKGPALFKQQRVGRDLIPFEIFKFRTMFVELSDCAGVEQVKLRDYRVTRLGRFLRRHSIDELPQLFNVVVGDMSIVGPRPHPVGTLAAGRDYRELVPHYDQRHAMRPGLSGWAQANGYRGPTNEPEKARARIDHDIAYIQNASIALDVKIILMTLWREFTVASGF
jgi:lipopolysaccharide/colanic/teichoic acid biosynthesis glycosyltransferase